MRQRGQPLCRMPGSRRVEAETTGSEGNVREDGRTLPKDHSLTPARTNVGKSKSPSCWHKGDLVSLDGHLNANETLPRRRFDRAGVTCHGSGSGQIEAVCVHHFDPGGNEVTHEFFAAVILSIDLGIGAKDRV